ncbi:MAG: hypothetical protein FWD71_14985 [Oscillospiraceae bacterium]|nr:hypothetical protein [Oscillospiraceae bacterium]
MQHLNTVMRHRRVSPKLFNGFTAYRRPLPARMLGTCGSSIPFSYK